MQQVKQAIKSVTPPLVWHEARRQAALFRSRKTSHLIGSAGRAPRYLEMDDLVRLDSQYERPSIYSYSAKAQLDRGEQRARTVREAACQLEAPVRSLEVAAYDGMVSAALAKSGWTASAIDRISSGLDPRAPQAGVAFREMDAARLEYEDDAFDICFSYDAFEHLPDPVGALKEMSRVVRPGGLIWLDFGPLYNSAFGLHAYRSVKVPFCQFLFERTLLDAYCEQNDRFPINYDQLNEWPLRRFRRLWRDFRGQLRALDYRETWSSDGHEMIRRYPHCFSGKDISYEEAAVSMISVLFRVEKAA